MENRNILIGLYTAFVLVVYKISRPLFSKLSYIIIFTDMPYVDRVLRLCLDIYLVRENQDFVLEEDLFSKLLFLFRSPETIIKWTRPPYYHPSPEISH